MTFEELKPIARRAAEETAAVSAAVWKLSRFRGAVPDTPEARRYGEELRRAVPAMRGAFAALDAALTEMEK